MKRFRQERARALRSRTTDAEQTLWRALQRVPVEGTHFRRQVPIGPYVADFGCLAARLLIELDGGHHSRNDVAARDRRRQAWLEGEGYRVLRFWNGEILDNLDGVLDTIYAALHGGTAADPKRFVHRRRTRGERSPHPGGFAADPPPAGEGGAPHLPLEGGGRRRRRREELTPVQDQAETVPRHPGGYAAGPPPAGEGGAHHLRLEGGGRRRRRREGVTPVQDQAERVPPRPGGCAADLPPTGEGA